MSREPTSSAPYREPAEMPLAIVPAAPMRGLVRANGSNCDCAPPGMFWCWWHAVARGDRWFCKHGGGWVRKYDGWWECISPEEKRSDDDD